MVENSMPTPVTSTGWLLCYMHPFHHRWAPSRMPFILMSQPHLFSAEIVLVFVQPLSLAPTIPLQLIPHNHFFVQCLLILVYSPEVSKIHKITLPHSTADVHGSALYCSHNPKPCGHPGLKACSTDVTVSRKCLVSQIPIRVWQRWWAEESSKIQDILFTQAPFSSDRVVCG